MKLIRCYIENFGKLHDFSCDFTDGENLFCKENGWGKSTFAAFIRAMFYGLEGERKRSISENERKRYQPWQGGTFGGRLVFEAGGKEYLVTRIFKDKEANDEFELRDAKTNLPSSDYSKELGRELFRIDKASFQRSVFIGQNECVGGVTDDINAKIGNLTEHTNDLNSFEAADGRLKDLLNALTQKRKTGKLAQMKDQVALLEREVKEGEAIDPAMNSYQEMIEKLEEELSKAREEQKKISKKQQESARLQDAASKKKLWEKHQEDVKVQKERAEALRKKFPGQMPTMEEADRAIQNNRALDLMRTEAKSLSLTPEEAAGFGKLEMRFRNGIPKAVEIQEAQEADRKLKALRMQAASLGLSEEEERELAGLEIIFKEDEDPVALAGRMTELWNERNHRKELLSVKRAALETMETVAAGTKKRRISPLLIAGILFAAVGIGLLAFEKTVAVLLLLIGIAGIVGGLVMSGRAGEKSEKTEEADHLRQEIEESKAQIGTAQKKLTAYLYAHGKTAEEAAVSAQLQELLAEAIRYTSLKKQKNAALQSPLPAQIGECERKITACLERFGVTGAADFTDALYRLQADAKSYRELFAQKQASEQAGKKGEELERQLHRFLTAYEFSEGTISMNLLLDIRDDLQDYTKAEENLRAVLAEQKAFEKEHDMEAILADIPEGIVESLKELQEQYQLLTEKCETMTETIQGYQKHLEALRERYDEWTAKQEELAELSNQYAELSKQYSYLEKTRKYLTESKEALTARYLGPVSTGFEKYYEMLTAAQADKYQMDANTNVTVLEHGKQRETAALSTGYQDLIGLALRIALADAMYPDETPFLVLDDPFVNLDQKKTEAGKQFLKEIAKKYQVIYFTCHSSRVS